MEQIPTRGLEVAGWNHPAGDTRGEFDPFGLPDGRTAIAVAEATGHGVRPALMLSRCLTLFRSQATIHDELTVVVEQINALLAREEPEDHFVSAFFGIVDGRGELSYLSAGQGPILRLRRGRDEVLELRPDSLPLGIVPRLGLPAPHRFAMQPGDMLVLVSDGIVSRGNARNEPFGVERVQWLLRGSAPETPAAELLDQLRQQLEQHAGGVPPEEDQTAVIIRWSGAAAAAEAPTEDPAQDPAGA